MSNYLIRPHHMLCLQFFEGKGYSEEFVENMMRIKNELDQNNPEVSLVIGADMICENCPNRRGNVCVNEEDVLAHDQRVFDRVKHVIKMDEISTWKEITDAIYENIIDAKCLKETCGHCMWSDICMNKNV